MPDKSVDRQISESSCFGKGFDCTARECIICEARKGCQLCFFKYIYDNFDDYYVDCRQSELYSGGMQLFRVEDTDGKSISLPISKEVNKEKRRVNISKRKNQRINKKSNLISYPDNMPNYSQLNISELQDECKKVGIIFKNTWLKMNYVTALRKKFILDNLENS